MDRRAFLASGAAVALGATTAGCLGGTEGDYDVAMTSDAYVPHSTATVPDDAPDWVPSDVPTVEVVAGDTVVWENTGARNHTVTAATYDHERVEELLGVGGDAAHSHDPRLPAGASFFSSGSFDGEVAATRSFIDEVNGGGVVPPGERYEHRFERPGWYHYYCIPHLPAGMMGNVHVLDA
ncbi:plastocyanin/azurin family copper-binding protein [Halarchaeum nitratireducens]|uniref:Halocyanin n=1 Tax=Halarchaeum nitratireducens TaxID=489913 RepID=A0A830G8T9_9EURY|nr:MULTISPECIES: plastocyanin/azurin family copper-binding protein [Halarchaeum]MBP2250011.1 plastocyanin [Halarchaeum solikamskense]GGN09123.1 halocyanin [Halarchaeum nitratireducens]